MFYGGSREAFAEHGEALSAVAGAVFVGEGAGLADLYDVALLSAMNGVFAGVANAFALVRDEDVPLGDFASLLSDRLTTMVGVVHTSAERLESGDHTTGVVSNLAMQARGGRTLLRTAEEQGVSTALPAPYAELMERRVVQGHGDEDGTGIIGLLAVP
ncbi:MULTISPECIES: imine reductase family protein [Nocardiopsis]|uniref:imine reductase family protein n=1 Tax=Nocardiopsis TaxID=2013 RepID=UPI001D0570DE|nr:MULTISPECIES: hypothetical protein [Nocardiopsis]